MRWTPADRIEIDVTPSEVTFLDNGAPPIQLAPIIYIDPTKRRLKVLAVGATPPEQPGALRIDLFDQAAPPLGVSKLDCLAAFFRKPLSTIAQRSVFRVRPEVLARGLDLVPGNFGGFGRDLFVTALMRAGARKVRWPEELGSS